MPFCSNCGQEIDSGAKFCSGCGTAVNSAGNESQRKITYEGEIHKCPNCGEIVDSLVTNCLSCGYEIRGSKISDTVQKFTSEIAQAENENQKISIIRNFPIPNDKESIFEFMILASSNFDANAQNKDKDLSDAWMVKFEQCYQKAKLIFNDDDFSKIKNIYDKCHSQMLKAKKLQNTKKKSEIIIKNSGVWFGIIALIVAVCVDMADGNSSMIELIGCILLIVSACILVKRKAILTEFGIGAISGVLTIVLSFLLENGSMLMLCGSVVLIIVAINFFITIWKKKE